MVTSPKEQALKRQPVYRNIHVTDLATYRLPPAGWVSILHRISGAAMFLLLPFTIWMFDASLTSEVSYEQFASVFSAGAAGLRHLWMDATHQVGLAFGRTSALVVIVLSTVVAFALGFKLFF